MNSLKAYSQSFPKISIVTPNYNQGSFLEKTILSVLNQDYPNLEYIIVDGGSTDESVEILKKYEAKLAYWISEPDNGQYHAVQKGFEKSSGEIMTYINSDDLLQPYSLFTVAEIFKNNPAINWINGFPNQIDEFNRLVWFGSLPNWTKYHYLNRQYKYIQQEGCFWNRKLWEAAGGYINTKYKLASDLDLWSRFFFHANLDYVPVVLGSFRLRSSGQTSLESINEYNLEAEEILLKCYENSSVNDRAIIKRYNSIFVKVLRKINIKYLFKVTGNINFYQLMSLPTSQFIFDRNTQKFTKK